MNGLIAPSGVLLECEMERSCVDGMDEMLLCSDRVCACPKPAGATPAGLLGYEVGGEFTTIAAPIAGIAAPAGSTP